MNKIYGEQTRPTNQPPLCDTCRALTTIQGTHFGDDVKRCHALGRITFHVTACNAYDDARLTPVYRLEETAWRWLDDRFVSPAELMRLNGHSATASAPAMPVDLSPARAAVPDAVEHPEASEGALKDSHGQ